MTINIVLYLQIYAMTLRLSTLFEAHIKSVIYDWKTIKPDRKSRTPNKHAGKKTRIKRKGNFRASTYAVDDSDVEDERKKPNNKQKTTSLVNGKQGSSSGTFTSDSQTALHKKINKKSETVTYQKSDVSSTDSNDSDDSSDIPLGTSMSLRKKIRRREEENDSGESYKPYTRYGSGKRKKSTKKSKLLKTNNSSPSKKNCRNKKSSSECEVSSGMAEGFASEASSEHDTSSADVLLSEVDRPLRRNGRRGGAEPTSTNNDINRRSRRNRYESDQSFRIENDNQSRSRRIGNLIETDSEQESFRQTRANIRRSQPIWDQRVQNNQTHSNDAENQRVTRRRPRISDSENSPEEASISKRVTPGRFTRSSAHQLNNDETSSDIRRSNRPRRQGNFFFVFDQSKLNHNFSSNFFIYFIPRCT